MKYRKMFDLSHIVRSAGRIAVAGHIRPDGDATGSTLGLYNYLKKTCPLKEVDIYLESPPSVFSYMKGFEQIRGTYDEEEEIYDVFFALDVSDISRLGYVEEAFKKSRLKVCVDHHISNRGFADINYIEASASSASELVYNLLDEAELDAEIARCLYTGIIHDTGVMRYSCTSPRTYEIAGKLIGYGFDFSKIIDETFYEKTYKQNLILGKAVLESTLFLKEQCIVSAISRQTMDFYEADGNDLDGIVNQLLLTKGVHCAIFMHETEPGVFKVSLRSDEFVDCSLIASAFGGGGHVRASGCTMNGTSEEILKNITAMLEAQLG